MVLLIHCLLSQEAELGLVCNEFGEHSEKEMRHSKFQLMLLHFSNSAKIQAQSSSVTGEITATNKPNHHVMKIKYLLIRLVRQLRGKRKRENFSAELITARLINSIKESIRNLT